MTKNRNIFKFFLVGMAAFLQIACQKDVSFQTSIVLKSWSQESSGDELYPVTDVVMYGFAADTTLYTVTSYEDALAGVMTHKKSPSTTLSAQLASTSCQIEGYGQAQIMPAPDYQSIVILAVNKAERLYGYTQLALVENLPYLYLSVQFQPWKESASYKNGQWWMFNDFYVPRIGCTVRPKIQHIEGEEPEYLKNSRLFAYRVEKPEEWLPADWENAEVGRLVNLSTGAIADPVYSYAADTQGNLAAKLPPEDLLVMVVNASERCYALRPFSEEEIRAEEEKADEEKGFEVVFPYWDLNPPHATSNGWVCYYTPSISATVVTTLQRRHNKEPELLTGATLYAYATSADEGWLPASIEDAAMGLLTHPTTGRVLEPEFTFAFNQQSSLQFSLPMGEYLLMVLHKSQCCYALGDFSARQVGSIFRLNFPISRTDFPFVNEEGWKVCYTPNHTGSIYTYLETEQPDSGEPETRNSEESGNENGEESDNEGDENPPSERNPLFPPYGEETAPPVSGTLIRGSVLHAYRVEEPEKWAPTNLVDARDGRLTHLETGERITPLQSFTADNSGAIALNLPYGEYLLLVTNYDNCCYALRTLSSKQKAVSESILFPTWRSDLPITDETGWTICYTPNLRADISISCQPKEGDEATPLDGNLLYAYRVEKPEEWYPISFADALQGRLTHIERQESAPIFYAYESERGEYTLSIDFLQGEYLILVVNRLGCCALRTLTSDQKEQTWELQFPLWRTDSPFIDESGWSVYNWYEAPNPEEPETPEEPEGPETTHH